MTEKTEKVVWEQNEGMWIPEKKEDEIVGVVAGFVETNKGSMVKIKISDEKEGEKVFLLNYPNLSERLQIFKGKEVRIVFIGKEKTPKGEKLNFDFFTRED